MRIAGLRALDLVGTAAVALWLGNWAPLPVAVWFVALWAVGTALHYIFDVKTPMLEIFSR